MSPQSLSVLLMGNPCFPSGERSYAKAKSFQLSSWKQDISRTVCALIISDFVSTFSSKLKWQWWSGSGVTQSTEGLEKTSAPRDVLWNPPVKIRTVMPFLTMMASHSLPHISQRIVPFQLKTAHMLNLNGPKGSLLFKNSAQNLLPKSCSLNIPRSTIAGL